MTGVQTCALPIYRGHVRASLYTKMIKRLLPGWDLYTKYDPVDGTIFSLTDRRAYDKPENKINEFAIDKQGKLDT